MRQHTPDKYHRRVQAVYRKKQVMAPIGIMESPALDGPEKESRSSEKEKEKTQTSMVRRSPNTSKIGFTSEDKRYLHDEKNTSPKSPTMEGVFRSKRILPRAKS